MGCANVTIQDQKTYITAKPTDFRILVTEQGIDRFTVSEKYREIETMNPETQIPEVQETNTSEIQ